MENKTVLTAKFAKHRILQNPKNPIEQKIVILTYNTKFQEKMLDSIENKLLEMPENWLTLEQAKLFASKFGTNQSAAPDKNISIYTNSLGTINYNSDSCGMCGYHTQDFLIVEF